MRGNVGAGMLAGAPMADASGSIPAGAMPRSAAYPLWAEVVGNWNTLDGDDNAAKTRSHTAGIRSEEHTSELQSLMRISYAVFCLKKKIEMNIRTTFNIYTKDTNKTKRIDKRKR